MEHNDRTAYIVADGAGRVVETNVGATTLLGWSAETFKTLTIHDLKGTHIAPLPMGHVHRVSYATATRRDGPLCCDWRIDTRNEHRVALGQRHDPQRQARYQAGLNAARRAALDAEFREDPTLPMVLAEFRAFIESTCPELLI